MRFGIAVVPGSSWSELANRARAVEDAGFDVLMTGDHLRHPFDPTYGFLDGWSVMTAWATITSSVRLAMYATNLIYRNPAVVARQAVAVDHISSGRLTVGLGAGIFQTDHAMAGVPFWSPAERVARVEEAVQILTRLLAGDTADFDGRFYRYHDAVAEPPSVQRPRPPVVLTGQGPKMLALAARYADGWNTFGGYEVDGEDAFYRRTEERARVLDEQCARIGREPATITKSVLAHHSVFDPWRSPDAFERIVRRFAQMGFSETIFYWPRDEDRARLDEIARDVMPRLRADLGKRGEP